MFRKIHEIKHIYVQKTGFTLAVSVRRMGRPGKVAFLLALFVLLGTLHGTKAQYDDYGFEDYDESDYDYDEDGDGEEADYQEEYADASGEGSGDEAIAEVGQGQGPMASPRNEEFTPMCNNENCWIRVDWEPPARDTWMSCILGYRVGFRKPGDDWNWINDEGTHIDVRSDELFFFEEAEGTNHTLTIRNLDFETNYEVIIEVFNPYGRTPREFWHKVATPPGSEKCHKSANASLIPILIPQSHAGRHLCLNQTSLWSQTRTA